MEENTSVKGISKSSGETIVVGSGKNGLLHIASNDDIAAAEARAEAELKKAQEAVSRPPIQALEVYLANLWEDCRKFKEDETSIQSTMIDSLNRRNARYDAEKMQKITQANSSDVFIALTGVKCRAFESWVHDIYVNAKRKRTWDLKPTPIVDIQEEDRKRIVDSVMRAVQQARESGENMTPTDAYEMASATRAKIISESYAQAGKKAEKMSRKIHDQLIEGGWLKAFSEIVMDLSTMKACIIKGPVIRRRKKRNGWETVDGITRPKIEIDEIMTFDRVSPLDFYPGRNNRCVDSGPLCEKMNIERSSLVENRDQPGYVKANIEHIASARRPPPTIISSQGEQRDDAENIDTVSESIYAGSQLPGIEFWCKVSGRDLVPFGIVEDLKGNEIDPLMDYDINAITVNGLLVYISLNEDELGRRPYSVHGYAKEVGGFWYMGIPELIKAEQDITNASARSMVNNLAIASGPQVIINDINRIPNGQNITSIHPWKIWQGKNPAGTTSPLVDFYQPDSRAEQLIGVMNHAMRLCDTTLEMPSYSYGNDKVAGAGRTASGLSMLMGSSNRGLKRIILGMDRNIFQTIVERIYDWNMQNLDNDDIKGDMNFISEGIVSMIMREQLSQSRMELLNATNNEFDQKILGLDGRAKILRDAIEALEADYDDIAPDEEKIRRLIDEERILQQQTIERNQIEIDREKAIMERELAVEMEKLQLEREKLQLDMQKAMADDQNMKRELDIRAAKNSQGLIERLMDKEEQDAGETEPTGSQGAGK